MDTPFSDQDALLAIARTVHDAPGYDAWNARFQDPTLRAVYQIAVMQLGDDICRAHHLPTGTDLAEAEAQSARAGHPTPTEGPQPQPWTKTTGEML